MNFKRYIFVGLILGAGWLGWHVARQQYAKALIEGLRSPSPDQVRKWAGLSENTHLAMFTNVPPGVPYFGSGGDLNFGKFEWLRAYEDRKGSNFDCFVIAVYESGAFWPSNRPKLIHDLELAHKNILQREKKLLQSHQELLKDRTFAKESDARDQIISPMTMPNGQKTYGFGIGLWPARFALHTDFDILVYEAVEPIFNDERDPTADLTEVPANSFYEFFTNVDSFVTSQ